ncbi:endonuclease [Kineobactrum sediminis]|uniref:Endonuclease n=1 Tax=Kineobactrum sediminis TaxID=1905677 RepID=A0A2N5Y2F5_9GAMM|nr:endonuclease/exonuclease/phosphatase family protein [Kineobactrum sediminis]PLW82580.1 endonuclease [Kineobactrum sediminis]
MQDKNIRKPVNPAAGKAPPSASELTVATYNIHACIGNDQRFDPERTVSVLLELDADVIALQEVEHHNMDGHDMLDYLANETGLTAIAGPTLLRATRRYGNALLTRLPVSLVNRIDLSSGGREPRGALEVMLDWDGGTLQLVATHLGLMPWERRLQVQQLISLFEPEIADTAVLMGDLNEWFLWGRPLRWLHAHFQAIPIRATWPAKRPVFALDRIWVDPRAQLESLEVHTSPLARMASDHLPLKGYLRRSDHRNHGP